MVSRRSRRHHRAARLRRILTSIAAGVEDDNAPGLATRLPPAVRERIGAAVRTSLAFEYLGEERIGEGHFSLDPAIARVRWYRARTPDGMRYFTVRLSRESGCWRC